MNKTIEAFGYPESLIRDYEHWVVLLRPTQVTVGSLVIAAKSEATHLGQLSDAEWAEFAKVSQDCEQLTRTEFDAVKFNYLALMMKDPNVHFHFIPRYASPVRLNGIEYKDPDWPLKTELVSLDMPLEDFEAVKSKLQR